MIDFQLTEQQELMRRSIRDFVQKAASPQMIQETDEQDRLPEAFLETMARAGWFALVVPEAYGGTGAGALDFSLALEAFAQQWPLVAHIFYSLYFVGADAIAHFGDESQKQQYLPRLAQGEMRVAMAITESGSGSDAAALATTARRAGDEWVLKGEKMFCTGANVSDVTMVAARTDPSLAKHKGISLFLVDRETPGVEIRPLKKLGFKGLSTTEIFLDDARVPAGRLLGRVNGGWDHLRQILSRERSCIAAIYTGGAQRAMEQAIAYVKERRQFGQPIAAFQFTKGKVADMQVAIEAARLLTYQAAWRVDMGLPSDRESSIAKLFATGAYMRIANQGLQMMGGYGYMMETEMQRHFRDAKLGEIGGGTSEIQRLVIARCAGL